MKIKVCGLTSIDQIQQLSALNVDYCGLIFYEKSPRFVSDKINSNELRKLSLPAKLVGVFVNENVDHIKSKIEEYGLAAVQLCGNESSEECNEIKTFAEVIKVFHVGDRMLQLEDYESCCDYFLFDTASDNYGGTGKKYDWKLLSKMEITKPFFISGGISSGDVLHLKQFFHPQLFGIDINSRFEISPGIKDIEKIKKFIHQLQTS